jgi:hypothetical protein
MGIAVNNIIIPENVPNVLHVNDINITRVIYNDVQVWLQRLNWLTPAYNYSTGWGGYSSYYLNGGGGGYVAGFINTGNLLATAFSINGGSEQGSWISVDGFGNYSGNSSSPNLYGYTRGWSGIATSGNSICMTGNANGGWLTLGQGVGWSGGTSTALGPFQSYSFGKPASQNQFSYNTSGFSFRFGFNGIYGNWITLM